MGWVVPAILAGTAAAGALTNRPSQQNTRGRQVAGGTTQNTSDTTATQTGRNITAGRNQTTGNIETTGTNITAGSQTGQTSNIGQQVGTTTGTSSLLPQFAPEAQPLLSELTQRYLQLAQNSPNEAAIAARGIREVNAGAELRKKALANILASRGLSTSPAGVAAEIAGESSRVSDAVGVRSDAPFQAQQLLAQNLGQASGFLNLLRGQTGTTTGTTDQTNVQTGTTAQQNQQQTQTIQNQIQNILQTSRTEEEINTRLQQLANQFGITNQVTDQTGTVDNPGNIAGGAATGGSSALALLLALGQIGGGGNRPPINVPGTGPGGVVGGVSVPGYP